MPTYSWTLGFPAPPAPVPGAIAFISVTARSHRRILLTFSEQVGAAGFTTLTFYSLVGEDGSAPGVVAAFVVASNPYAVELALDTDLTDGMTYAVSAVGVPDTDVDVTPAGSVLPLRLGVIRTRPVAQSPYDDSLADAYGVDLYWDGLDFVEDAKGDLATISGRENAHAAVKRRLVSDGLPWDDTYGAKPREYVDGSPLTAHELRGALASQAVADDRVKRASATVLPEDEANPGHTTIETTIVLIDGTSLDVQSKVS